MESKEEAERYYTEAFKQGMLKAGVALARVYQKDHKTDEAQKIYQKIKEKYQPIEIIGVQCTTNDLIQLLKECEQW